MNDEIGKKLHDRRTRGQDLSDLEQEQLESWYAELDQAEVAGLGLDAAGLSAGLPVHIEKTLIRISKTAQRIRELDRKADEIRQENAALRLRLGHRASTQHA